MKKNISRYLFASFLLLGGMFFLQNNAFAEETTPTIATIKSEIKTHKEDAEKLLETMRASEKGDFKDNLSVLDSLFIELQENSESKIEEYQSINQKYETLITNEQTKKAIIEYKRIPPVRSGGILPGPDRNYSGGDYIKKKFIPKFINTTITLLFSVSIIILIISGVMYIIGSGDQDAIKKAKDMSLWAIAGTILAIFSYAIVKFIIGINFGA